MSVPVAWINSAGANSIALSVTDTGGGQIWGAFALDVECAGGLHSYVSSNEGGIALSATLDYNIPPANDGDGDAWYETDFDDSAWGSAVMVTDKTWAKLLYNPADGTVVDPYSYDAIGNSGANEYDMNTGQNMLYMRKTFTLNPVAPLPSPTITITKFSDTTNMILGGPVRITLTVCSMGGYINGSVMITDTWTSDAACGWTMGGPFYYDDLNNGQLFRDDDNDRFTLYFPLGFEANECKTFTYEMNPCWFDTTVYDYGNVNAYAFFQRYKDCNPDNNSHCFAVVKLYCHADAYYYNVRNRNSNIRNYNTYPDSIADSHAKRYINGDGNINKYGDRYPNCHKHLY
jgi:hypothetical protein